MTKKKFYLTISVFVVLCIFTTILDWIKWDMSEYTTPLFNNFAIITIMIVFLILLIWGVFFIFFNIKNNKIMSWVPILIVFITIGLHTVIPLTNIYMKIDYILNRNAREEIVQMVKNNEIKSYQTDISEYTFPSKFRLTSHVGKIFTQKENTDMKKVLFYVHCGIWKSSAIIYVPDDDILIDGDFGRKFDSISLLNKNWYAVTMHWDK